MATIEVEKDEGVNDSNGNKDFIPGKPYSKLRRDLTDDDLSNPAVQRLLINEIDKLEMIIAKLEVIQSEYYLIDKQKAVLEEKIKFNTSSEIMYGFCLAIGSGLLGLASLPQLKDFWWVSLVLGGLLIIGGIISRYNKWN